MKDREFLLWIHQRLALEYGIDLGTDYMMKLRSIIEKYPKDKETPNTGPPIEKLVDGDCSGGCEFGNVKKNPNATCRDDEYVCLVCGETTPF